MRSEQAALTADTVPASGLTSAGGVRTVDRIIALTSQLTGDRNTGTSLRRRKRRNPGTPVRRPDRPVRETVRYAPRPVVRVPTGITIDGESCNVCGETGLFSVKKGIIRSFLHSQASAAAFRHRVRRTPGELAIDYEQRRVTVAGRAVHLTPTEFELLHILSIDAGRVVT